MNKNKKIILHLINISLIVLLFTSSPLGLKIDSTQNKEFIGNSVKTSNGSGLTFRRAVPSGPTVLDPVDCWELASKDIIRQVCETLWYYNWTDYNMGRINMLSKNQIWLNTTALSVNLRQGIQFHDGTTFDADAVKWNFDRLLYLTNSTGTMPSDERESSPASLYKDPAGDPLIESFEITGTYSGIIHLTQPFSTIMDLLCYTAGVMISPTAHAANDRSFIDLDTGDLVGTGPYKYDRYIAEQEVDFSRWDNYWGGPMPIEGKVAYFERMIYVVIDDPSTRNYAMLSHDVDWLEGAITDLFPIFRSDPTIKFTELENAGLKVSYLAFNNKQINITWRKAMCYAFNYSYMIHDYWQDRVFRSYGWVSPGYGEWYTDKQEELGPYYNLTIARMILVGDDPTLVPVDGIPEAAGRDPLDDNDWGLGANQLIAFNYSYNTDNQWRADLYSLLRNYFQDLSILIYDGGTDWAYFILRAYGYVPGGYDELQMFWVEWGPDYLDPINMIQPLLSNISTSNSAQVNDPWIEAAFKKYFTLTEHAQRVSMIHNISIYCITILFSHMFGFFNKGTTIHSADIYWDVENEVLTYSFLRYDFYAYPLKSNSSIQIISSGDIEYLENETGNFITWNLSADSLSNPYYYVYRDEELILSDTWISGDSINVNVDGLYAGKYTYKIVVQNWGKSYESYINVHVISKLSITRPFDINYLEGTTGNNIAWYVLNGTTQNAIYYIYDETDIVQSDAWQRGVPIVLNVDGLFVGSYSYRIEVHNSLEFIEDTVKVNVFISPGGNLNEPPQITINSPKESEIFGSSAPEYNISIINSYDTIWYTIDDGVTNITTEELFGAVNQTEWDKKEDGIINLKFYAINAFGLIGNAEVMIVKHVSGGGTPGVPGYNLLALVGIAGITTLLVLKKKFKK